MPFSVAVLGYDLCLYVCTSALLTNGWYGHNYLHITQSFRFTCCTFTFNLFRCRSFRDGGTCQAPTLRTERARPLWPWLSQGQPKGHYCQLGGAPRWLPLRSRMGCYLKPFFGYINIYVGLRTHFFSQCFA